MYIIDFLHGYEVYEDGSTTPELEIARPTVYILCVTALYQATKEETADIDSCHRNVIRRFSPRIPNQIESGLVLRIE